MQSFFARCIQSFLASQEKQHDEHHKLYPSQSRFGKSQRFFALFFLFLVLAVVFHHFIFMRPSAETYTDPEIVDLTASKHEWDVYWGEPESCDRLDCHLLPEADQNRFIRRAVLPIREFPLRDYSFGLPIYYRTKVEVSDRLKKIKDLGFHSFYVWAKSYQVYVDGVAIENGRGPTQINALIPQNLIRGKKSITIAIKVESGDLPFQGISHFGSVALGSLKKFNPLRYQIRDSGISNYWFKLFPRIFYCCLFSMVILVISRNKENLIFLIYCIVAMIRPVVSSTYGQAYLPEPLLSVPVQLLSDVFAMTFFLLAVHWFFRQRSRLFTVFYSALFLSLMVYAAIAPRVFDLPTFSLYTSYVSLFVKIVAFGYGAFVATTTALNLILRKANNYRLYTSAVLAGMFLFSTVATATGFIDSAVSWDWSLEVAYEFALFSLLGAAAFIDFSKTYARKDEFSEQVRLQAKELARSEADRAVARMTQMLAHDVRKPFSVIRMLMKSIEAEKNPHSMFNALRMATPEIDRLIYNAEGMLSDVIEIGRDGDLIKEPIHLGELIEKSLDACFRMKADYDISFFYSLRHRNKILVNESKFQRVVDNIIENAAQAMKGKGRIWVRSTDIKSDRNDFIEIVIGNNGPAIESSKLRKIFDVFFSENKSSGTGLGLAVSKKIIEDHGGSISVRSSKRRGTEFIIQIEASNEIDVWDDTTLPQSSVSMAQFGYVKPPPRSGNNLDLPEIAVIDDDPYVCELWRSNVTDAVVHTYSSPEEFIKQADDYPEELKRLGCIITDYCFQNSAMNGVDLAKVIKQNYGDAVVLLCSDFTMEKDCQDIHAVIKKDAHSWRELDLILSGSGA